MNDFQKGMGIGIFMAFAGIVIAARIFFLGLPAVGEPLSISAMGGEIVVVERLSPRNLAIVKTDSGEKIVSDLPIGLEKGDISRFNK